MNEKRLTFGQAIEDYSLYLAHEQHASRTTQTGYKSWLRRFRRFLEDRHGRDPALAEVTEEDIRGYYYGLSGHGLRPRTLRGALYPLRGLFSLAVERNHLTVNPALALKLPRKDAAIRATVSDEELERLIAACERAANPTRRRLGKAVLSALVFGGIRRQELLDLRASDVDLSEGSILVRSGKGSKSRSVYVCRGCVEALRDWLDVRPRVDHDYLFVADGRRRLGDVGLARLISEAKSMADLRDSANITPHAMRHAAATRLMRNGADLKSIQQFLGHSSLQTTATYLHTDERQLRRISDLTAFGNEPGADGKGGEEEARDRARARTERRTTTDRVPGEEPRRVRHRPR